MKILKKSYHLINPVSDWHKPENQNAPMCEKHPFLVRFFRSNFIHNRTSILRKHMYMRKYYNPENPEILKILVQTKNAFVVAQFIAPLILHSIGAISDMETKVPERQQVYSKLTTNYEKIPKIKKVNKPNLYHNKIV